MNECKWAVFFYVDGGNHDDGKRRLRVVALFRYPYQAEEFISMCLPAETRKRFGVINTDNLKEDDDAEPYKN